jgi:hypothetical protein
MYGTEYQTPAGGEERPVYSGPPPPPLSKKRGRKSGTSKPKTVTVAVVIALIAVAAAIGAGLAAMQPTNKASASAVRLEPTAFAGEGPFVAPVGHDQTVAAAPANTGGEFSGATAGLFTQNPAVPSCDGQALVAALQADPQKETAWANAQKIQTTDIPGFVSNLTPVLLRSDTSVTVYGYDAPDFFPYPAVFQAGTAVFVNDHGEPTVKCYNGDPLASRAAPAPPVEAGGAPGAAGADGVAVTGVSYVGPSWPTFESSSVTVVQPSSTVNEVFCIGGNATGGTTIGGATVGGGPGSVTTGGPTTGGTTTGGAGCVTVNGGSAKLTDCKKNPTANECAVTTPPPTPVDCVDNPAATACQPVVPGADCQKNPVPGQACPGVVTAPRTQSIGGKLETCTVGKGCTVTDPKTGTVTAGPVCQNNPTGTGCAVSQTPPTDLSGCTTDPKGPSCSKVTGQGPGQQITCVIAPCTPGGASKTPPTLDCPPPTVKTSAGCKGLGLKVVKPATPKVVQQPTPSVNQQSAGHESEKQVVVQQHHTEQSHTEQSHTEQSHTETSQKQDHTSK